MPAEIVSEPQLILWANHVIGDANFREDAKCLGLVRGDEVLGVVVYESFSRFNVNMHVASDGSRRWLNRAFMMAAFNYPFIQCGLQRVTGLVPSHNRAALEFDLRLGFQIEGRMRAALRDEDMIILGMLRQECPFVPKEVSHG